MSSPNKNFYDEYLKGKLLCLYGFVGVTLSLISIVIAVFLSPGYNWVYDTVSSLGYGPAKSFFSIGMVIGGCLAIPFFIYFDNEVLKKLDYVKDGRLFKISRPIRGLATALAILMSLCIALVGILPDENYPALFIGFHIAVAFISFVGTGIYILFFSILLFKQQIYENTKFPKLHPYLGFLIVGCIILMFALSFTPIFAMGEWITTISLFVWILITSSILIFNKKIRHNLANVQK